MSPLPAIPSRGEVVPDLASGKDREVILLRLAPGVGHDELRKRVVGVVRRARRAAEAEQ